MIRPLAIWTRIRGVHTTYLPACRAFRDARPNAGSSPRAGSSTTGAAPECGAIPPASKYTRERAPFHYGDPW